MKLSKREYLELRKRGLIAEVPRQVQARRERKRPEKAPYLSLKAFPIGRTVVFREQDAKIYQVDIEL